MKLTKLFTAAAATAALSLSLAFSANAALITQTFELEVDGDTATLEIGALTENADPFFDTEFLWEDDAIEFFSISNNDTVDLFLSGDDLLTAFNFFSASAYLNSVSGDGAENGFFEILFELNLDVIDDMLAGVVEVGIFNDDIEIGGFFSGFNTLQDEPFEGSINVTPGSVKVSAPATALLILLSIGGLVVARRK